MNAVVDLGNKSNIKFACAALSVPRASFYRFIAKPNALMRIQRPAPPLALGKDEKQNVSDLLHSERFQDSAPHQVYATLLDEGQYHCSV